MSSLHIITILSLNALMLHLYLVYKHLFKVIKRIVKMFFITNAAFWAFNCNTQKITSSKSPERDRRAAEVDAKPSKVFRENKKSMTLERDVVQPQEIIQPRMRSGHVISKSLDRNVQARSMIVFSSELHQNVSSILNYSEVFFYYSF